MKFKHGTRRRAIEYEKAIVEYWKKNRIFEKSIERRSPDETYVFYDGPPFITGVPHHGTLLSSIVKDAVPRYWTMKGKRVERRWGWDCHGLPAENFVEKQLGITDRREIGTKITLEEYITKARESMVANSATWENIIDRIGRWVDFRGAYRTMDSDFMESVWWAFKKLYEAGKIYEGEKVLMYDTKFATPVSKNEVTMDNDAYRTVTDPSVYVKFKLTPESIGDKTRNLDLPVYFLAWTTTPWTLPGNAALAVNPEMNYSEVRVGDEIFIVAKDLRDKVLVDDKNQLFKYEIIQDIVPGAKLVGKSYEPLFARENSVIASVAKQSMDRHDDKPPRDDKNIYKIWPADFVSAENGTGIVHAAPAYGEDDFALAKEHDIPALHAIDDDGYYLPEFAAQLHAIGVRDTDETGIEVWAANKHIAKCLREIGAVWKIEYIEHEYPFNPRSNQRIMYRAIPSWFFDVQNSKTLMLEQNENINWFPPHLKNGRFAKNIEQAPDWNLSRDRFWATAMPVWKGDRGTVRVVGSYAELEELSGKKLEDYHRPWVDEITFEIDGEKFTRIEKVLDGWFEAGSMPFAQLHYPFENQEKFEQNYPADFISEYVAQVRAWFYYVHVINTALAEIGAFGDLAKTRGQSKKNAFENVIVTGTLAGNDGRKMSKSLGNYTDPNELMDKFSADSLRFLLLSCPVLSGEDFALTDKDVSDVARKLEMIWNVYDFFTMYAEVDGWEYEPEVMELSSLKNPLDIWIVSRYRQLRDHITRHMDEYNIPDAMSAILPFVDDLSNWFVRRSRRRFWKSEDDADKTQAYQTLHYALRHLSYVLAPFTPFLAEELCQKLTGDESVHLLNWPKAGEIDEKVLSDMARAREIIESGLALRMNRDDEFGQIKIRQPLTKLEYSGEKLDDFYEQIIADEVNVKSVIAKNNKTVIARSEATKQSSNKNLDNHDGESPRDDNEVALDKKITPELKREGQAREIVRFVQNARKDAGLNVDDRIVVNLTTSDSGLKRTIDEFRDVIAAEILATKFATNDGHQTSVKIDGAELDIQLEKEEKK
ncbi:isoleucine--tRNA ligase [Candidatus Saccharibacteria bacterium]|nr:isoleucine--tRNA ligase [Candidatus Saccharibacteria bacterium]